MSYSAALAEWAAIGAILEAAIDDYPYRRVLTVLGYNLAIAGALGEAARRARIPCETCGELPCQGNHPGLAGPCCVCCPASTTATGLGDE